MKPQWMQARLRPAGAACDEQLILPRVDTKRKEDPQKKKE